jgi:hypothetical protein
MQIRFFNLSAGRLETVEFCRTLNRSGGFFDKICLTGFCNRSKQGYNELIFELWKTAEARIKYNEKKQFCFFVVGIDFRLLLR